MTRRALRHPAATAGMDVAMRTAALIALSIVVAALGPLQAQDAPLPPAPLRVEDAVARATVASHRLAELMAREGGARASADARVAARRPAVVAHLGYTRTNPLDEFGVRTPDGGIRLLSPSVPNNYSGRLELRWPIYTGGRLEALSRAAEAEVSASGQDLAMARADLRLEVTRAFWAVVTARESAGVLEQAVARVDAQLHDVRTRFDAGFVPPNDVLSVEAQRSRQQLLLIEARNEAAVAEADLARLIDAPEGTMLRLDAALDEPAGLEAPPVHALIAEARDARADRAALELRTRAALEREEAAAAGGRPSVAVVSGVDYARPNPRIFPREDTWRESWDVGVALSWSVWDGGRVRAERGEAAQQALATRERLAEFDSVLALQVRQRTLDLSAAHAQIAAAADGVRAAAEARRVVQERFAAGVATSTELLDAQVALLQAELDRTRALANARLARARLDHVTGR